jgi:hypothetical protein
MFGPDDQSPAARWNSVSNCNIHTELQHRQTTLAVYSIPVRQDHLRSRVCVPDV